ncbi:hypothetical protein C8Q74DRAFT_236591 [Fomes fomentarius]|nr:hypothetical protein C8Q74DRAFT_236591 [Fomes fomentarius]
MANTAYTPPYIPTSPGLSPDPVSTLDHRAKVIRMTLPPVSIHRGIPHFAVHKSHLRVSPTPGAFRLDLPEHGDFTLSVVPKDVLHVTVNSSQLCKTPVPDWFYVPIHVFNPRKPSICFLPLPDLIYANLPVVPGLSDQPSGHSAARPRPKVIPRRRTGIVRCTNCRDAHKKCSGVSPHACERCVKLCIQDTCHSAATRVPDWTFQGMGPSPSQGYSQGSQLHGLSSAPQAFITAPRVSSWPNQQFSTQQEDPSALQGPYYQRTAGIESALINGSIAPRSEHHMHYDVHGIDVNNWPGYVDNYAGPSQGA